MFKLDFIHIRVVVSDKSESVVLDEPVNRPRQGVRVPNRNALRRNNRNVIGKLKMKHHYRFSTLELNVNINI